MFVYLDAMAWLINLYSNSFSGPYPHWSYSSCLSALLFELQRAVWLGGCFAAACRRLRLDEKGLLFLP
jgi:hypothetical protein